MAKLYKSGEDYLEAILMLHIESNYVRAVDIAHELEVSKPSVSRAVSLLKQGEYLTMDKDGFLWLTEAGREVAEKIYIKMHNMTIRTAILREHGVHIDEHCYYVDSEFILYPIPYVKTIAFLRDFVYMYRIGVSGQSMSREKMKQNEESVNRVLRSLFRMYRKLGGSIPVSQETLCYIENLIARIVAGKYRIMLCRELSEETCARMKRFDDMLRRKYPRIYRANINKAVKVLRRSDFRLYVSASVLCKLAYH